MEHFLLKVLYTILEHGILD